MSDPGDLPQMRASQIHSNLATLRSLGGPVERQVRTRLSRAVLDRIESANRTTWLPVGLDVALTDAVDAAIGREGSYRWSRDSLLLSMELPLLQPLVTGAVRLFGAGPASMFRLAPRAWGLIYKHCGVLEYVARGDRSGALVYRGIPSVIRGSAAYLSGLAASFEAPLVFLDTGGTVAIDDTQLAQGRMVYEIGW